MRHATPAMYGRIISAAEFLGEPEYPYLRDWKPGTRVRCKCGCEKEGLVLVPGTEARGLTWERLGEDIPVILFGYPEPNPGKAFALPASYLQRIEDEAPKPYASGGISSKPEAVVVKGGAAVVPLPKGRIEITLAKPGEHSVSISPPLRFAPPVPMPCPVCKMDLPGLDTITDEEGNVALQCCHPCLLAALRKAGAIPPARIVPKPDPYDDLRGQWEPGSAYAPHKGKSKERYI